MLVTKSLENMIDKEEASAFNAFTDGRVHKSNGFDPSDTSEIINVTLTSTRIQCSAEIIYYATIPSISQ